MGEADMGMPPSQRAVKRTTGHFRAVSTKVFVGRIPVPDYDSAAALDAFDRTINGGVWSPGDILGVSSPLPASIEARMAAWLTSCSFKDVQALEGSGLMAVEGSLFHYDADHYSDELFCALWLEQSREPWDLVFPDSSLRIPLLTGTIVAFDQGNIHGVVARGESSYDPYGMGDEGLQLFASLNFDATADNLALFGSGWVPAEGSGLSDAWMGNEYVLCNRTGELMTRQAYRQKALEPGFIRL